MPMNEEVRKAVDNLDGTALAMHRDWQTIRARLAELEAENERLQAQLDAGTEAGWHALWNERDELRRQLSELRESTHYANGVADLAMKHRDAAESRLAAADALLREIMEFGEDRELHIRIQDHLTTSANG